MLVVGDKLHEEGLVEGCVEGFAVVFADEHRRFVVVSTDTIV